MMHPPGVVPPGGVHILVDLFDAERLDDLDYVRSICVAAAEATGATILTEHFHHFGEGCGISGVVLLAESHLSIHTWPENGIATVDIFVCGDCQAREALPILMLGFNCVKYTTIQHARGVENAISMVIR